MQMHFQRELTYVGHKWAKTNERRTIL